MLLVLNWTNLVPLVLAAGAIGALVWAWSETFARIREAEAGLGKWPRFTVFTLLAASAFMIAGMILLSQLIGNNDPGLLEPMRSYLPSLVLLPAVGLALTALLARLDRSYGWSRLLFERNRNHAEREIATEQNALLADTFHAGLDPAVKALEAIVHEMQREDGLRKEVHYVLRTIEREVEKMRRLQSLSKQLSTNEPRAESADAVKTCEEIATRLKALDPRPLSIQVFGADTLHLAIPQHHLNAMLWGPLRIAAATADESEPVIEILFDDQNDRVTIELQSNGRSLLDGDHLDDDLSGAIEESRMVATLHEARVLPETAPYPNSLCLILDGSLACRPQALPTPAQQEPEPLSRTSCGPLGSTP